MAELAKLDMAVVYTILNRHWNTFKYHIYCKPTLQCDGGIVFTDPDDNNSSIYTAEHSEVEEIANYLKQEGITTVSLLYS